jgi:hypothetical protein
VPLDFFGCRRSILVPVGLDFFGCLASVEYLVDSRQGVQFFKNIYFLYRLFKMVDKK